MAIHAVRMAALPEAQATSVSQVGMGVRFRYSWTTPATDRCLWYSGTAPMIEALSSLRSIPASSMARRKASKASSCTVASLRLPNRPCPTPITPTRDMNSSQTQDRLT